jgi:hypothetical protein
MLKMQTRAGWLEFNSWHGWKIFSSFVSRPALGPTQAASEWLLGALSLGVKRPGHEAEHSPPSSAKVKNEWNCTSITPYIFMAWCSISTRDYFTFSPTVKIQIPAFECGMRLKLQCNLLLGRLKNVQQLFYGTYQRNNYSSRFWHIYATLKYSTTDRANSSQRQRDMQPELLYFIFTSLFLNDRQYRSRKYESWLTIFFTITCKKTWCWNNNSSCVNMEGDMLILFTCCKNSTCEEETCP